MQARHLPGQNWIEQVFKNRKSLQKQDGWAIPIESQRFQSYNTGSKINSKSRVLSSIVAQRLLFHLQLHQNPPCLYPMSCS
jgi:hypothetical protein